MQFKKNHSFHKCFGFKGGKYYVRIFAPFLVYYSIHIKSTKNHTTPYLIDTITQ